MSPPTDSQTSGTGPHAGGCISIRRAYIGVARGWIYLLFTLPLLKGIRKTDADPVSLDD